MFNEPMTQEEYDEHREKMERIRHEQPMLYRLITDPDWNERKIVVMAEPANGWGKPDWDARV